MARGGGSRTTGVLLAAALLSGCGEDTPAPPPRDVCPEVQGVQAEGPCPIIAYPSATPPRPLTDDEIKDLKR